MRAKTTEQFIQDARAKHGDRYDYSESRYINAHSKIIIICPDHGRFEQKAYAHLQYGCKRCGCSVGAHRRATSVEDFIRRAGELHNYKYDYRQVAFARQHDKITIICPTHGCFEQPVNDHLKGHGCAKCGNLMHGHRSALKPNEFLRRAIEKHGQSNSRLAFSEFLSRAHLRHGARYDYVEFQAVDKPVGIICAEHGFFRQRGADHLDGHGCPSCARAQIRDALRYTRSEIEQQLEIKFEDQITLGDEYFDTATPVHFVCVAHGDFKISPMNVLQSKHGCGRCARESSGALQRLSQDEFERKANITHASKYRYGRFITTDEPMEINCPRHGSFLQNAGNHLAGYGCPRCGRRRCEMQNSWLDKLGISEREVPLMINGRRFVADGYDPSSKTVYEFWGDFWHGNPRVYKADDVNTVCNVTFGELYEKTKAKVRTLIATGYQVVEIWEKDWRRMNE